MGLLALGFLCCLICKYKDLKTAIDCIDAAADFLAKTKMIIGVPVLFFLINIIAVSLWIGAFGAVVSMNHWEVVEGGF